MFVMLTSMFFMHLNYSIIKINSCVYILIHIPKLKATKVSLSREKKQRERE